MRLYLAHLHHATMMAVLQTASHAANTYNTHGEATPQVSVSCFRVAHKAASCVCLRAETCVAGHCACILPADNSARAVCRGIRRTGHESVFQDVRAGDGPAGRLPAVCQCNSATASWYALLFWPGFLCLQLHLPLVSSPPLTLSAAFAWFSISRMHLSTHITSLCLTLSLITLAVMVLPWSSHQSPPRPIARSFSLITLSHSVFTSFYLMSSYSCTLTNSCSLLAHYQRQHHHQWLQLRNLIL